MQEQIAGPFLLPLDNFEDDVSILDTAQNRLFLGGMVTVTYTVSF